MQTIGAKLIAIEKGVVKIECAYHPRLTQQHGYLHAGVLTTMVDVACGYAALTMMPIGTEVLTVEFKSTFMRAAKADKVIATGRVIKAGSRLTFCEGTVTDETGEIEFARMTATMICVKK